MRQFLLVCACFVELSQGCNLLVSRAKNPPQDSAHAFVSVIFLALQQMLRDKLISEWTRGHSTDQVDDLYSAARAADLRADENKEVCWPFRRSCAVRHCKMVFY
jgi:hypothetical protein